MRKGKGEYLCGVPGVSLMVARILILLMIVGCSSTKPTPYQKEKKKEGYRDSTFEGMKVASFKGNAYSKKDLTQSYAQFRAIDQCKSTEGKHANIIDIFDKTIEQEITRTTGSSWGPSYYGMYPYYSRYSSFGLSAGFDVISGNSWNEILAYPVFEIYYTCEDKIVRPQLIFKELSADEIKHLVKDVKGGLQVDEIPAHSPNKGVVELGDIVLKANGRRIEQVYELIRLFSPSSTEVSVLMLRDGQKVVAKLKSVDITSQVASNENEIIGRVCKEKEGKKQEKLEEHNLCKYKP